MQEDTEDTSSIPGLGKSLGEGNGNLLQYSCLENPMDRGAWWATANRVEKWLDTTEQLSTHMHLSCLQVIVSLMIAKEVVSGQRATQFKSTLSRLKKWQSHRKQHSFKLMYVILYWRLIRNWSTGVRVKPQKGRLGHNTTTTEPQLCLLFLLLYGMHQHVL